MSFYKMRTKDILRSTIFVMMALLLSFAILTQNPLSSQQLSSSVIPSLAYADKIKLANPPVNEHHHHQHQYKQQHLLSRPPLSFGDNNDDGIGITQFTLPMNNKIIVPATTRGIPNQFVVVLKDSSTIPNSISNTPSTLSIPSPLGPSNTDGLDGSSSSS